jgi:tetratricopeptide (TPR) repeat protein
VHRDTSVVLWYHRRHAEALEECRTTLEMEPRFVSGRWVLGLIYEQMGQLDRAVRALREGLDIAGGMEANPQLAGALGHAYALWGRRGEAEEVLREMSRATERRWVCPFHFALIHAALGNIGRAFNYLEDLLEARSYELVSLSVDPRWDELRGDERFQAILRRMGLDRRLPKESGPFVAASRPPAPDASVGEAFQLAARGATSTPAVVT